MSPKVQGKKPQPSSLPTRGRNTGTGKQKRNVVSTMSQSLHRGAKAQNLPEGFPVEIPENVTGTGEQGS